MIVWSTLILATSLQSGPTDSAPSVNWSVENPQVSVGGCVTLVAKGSRRSLPRDLTVSMRDRTDLNLRSTPYIEYDEKSIWLLWANLREFDLVTENPRRVRQRPLFDKPGAVELILSSNGQALGSQTVTVVPVTQEAEDALRLLYPVVEPDKTPPTHDIAWVLAFGRSYERSSDEDDAAVPRLQATIQTICKHPDWRQVAPAIMQHRRLQQQIRVVRQESAKVGQLPASSEAQQELDRISDAIRAEKSNSTFALGVQDQSYRIIAHIKRSRSGAPMSPAQAGRSIKPASQPSSAVVIPP